MSDLLLPQFEVVFFDYVGRISSHAQLDLDQVCNFVYSGSLERKEALRRIFKDMKISQNLEFHPLSQLDSVWIKRLS